ncbi:MAG: putative baseplate assembly protein [Chloroflexota bacterium]
MSLQAPNLDDRRFQDLVDDAKRLVQQRCPEWTDHNVSDPGVTMIETFAWMTDQLLYRLNRVPERHYIKFLELIGVRLFPPAAAHADVTFWLSAPQEETISIAPRTQVATARSQHEAAVVFETTAGLDVVTCSHAHTLSSVVDGAYRDHDDVLALGNGFFCFDSTPKPGDALLVGLDVAVPSCALRLRFSCRIEGVGVDPDFPPLVWEAWTSEGWAACEVDDDMTGGLNRDGDITLHVPPGHEPSVLEGQRAGWIRARVSAPVEGQPTYSASPEIRALSAATVGGTVGAANSETISDEIVGTADGASAATFSLKRSPILLSEEAVIVEISTDDGWQAWAQPEARNFAGSEATDRHVLLDAVAGEIQFGPAIRVSDGGIKQHGAVPPAGASIRVPVYHTGGGARGNVTAHAISVLKSSIPYVARVENRRAASGGVDGEDIEDAKVRGPILLRTRDRAVTAEDFEHLAREAAPELARVHCVVAGAGADAGGVRVLVVPAVASDGSMPFDVLLPSEASLGRVARRLDESRLVGTRISVEPPTYRGVTIVARLTAQTRTDPARLQEDAEAALFAYFHPTRGGPDGAGWPFGRPVLAGEVFAVLGRLRGTEIVEEVRVFGADPVTGERGKPSERLEVEPHALVFSYQHQVVVQPS